VSVFFVYGLFDPRDWTECRYVGATSRLSRPQDRRRPEDYVGHWVRSVPYVGWKILEACDSWTETLQYEKEWILSFKVAGHRLTNLTDGGAGFSSDYCRDTQLRLSESDPYYRSKLQARNILSRAPDVIEKERKRKKLVASDPRWRARQQFNMRRVCSDPEVLSRLQNQARTAGIASVLSRRKAKEELISNG